MQRQGALALPQRIINAIGLPAAMACGAALLLLLLWVVWLLVLKPLVSGSAAYAEKKGEEALQAGAAAEQSGSAEASPRSSDGEETPGGSMRKRRLA